jgi:predicted secreted hydrolase
MSGRCSIVAASLAVLLGGCPTCPDPFYELTTPDPRVRLPLDEAPHCFGGGEWWYYSGRLSTDAGAQFGIEAVIFHVPPLPIGVPTDLWSAHYAVIDVQTGRFQYDQVVEAGPHGSALTPGRGFNLGTSLIQMRGEDGSDVVEARFRDGDYALRLALRDLRGAVLHGGDGYVPHGSGWSFYYSRPRMAASGTLQLGDATLAVSGDMWFDRQWGRDLNDPHLPWDWYSIRLDEGTDIMLYTFPGRDGPVAFGTVVPAVGPPSSLAADEFRISPSATWVSPATSVAYAVAWDIELPGQGVALQVKSVVDDAELDTRSTTQSIYWEGLCTVDGYIGGEPVSGYAYVEQANGGS